MKNIIAFLLLLCHNVASLAGPGDLKMNLFTREQAIFDLINRLAAPTTAPQPDIAPPEGFDEMGMDKKLEWWVNQQFLPSSLTRHERLCRLMTQLKKSPLFVESQAPVIPEDSLRELDVLIGSGSTETQRAHCIANRIDRTSLHIGYLTLLRHLVQVKSPEHLRELHLTASRICEVPQIAAEIQQVLAEFAPVEDTFLSFWMEESTPDVLAQILEQIQFTRMPFMNDWLNSSPMVITFYQLQEWGIKFGSPLITVGAFGFACYTTNPLLIILSAYAMIDQLMGIPENIRQVKVRLMALYLMQKKLISVARFVSATQRIHHALSQIPEAKELARHLEISIADDKLAQLIDLLSRNTFQSYPSYLSHWGNICVAYQHMLKLKNRFIKAYATIGTVDLLISLRQFLNSSTEQAPICIAEFQTAGEEPQIQAEHFWSPLLDPATVVTNSTTLGGAEGQKVHILTGPNARGKTTIMRSLAGAALLASTLGIASAESICVPPYLDFLTSINVGDDPANQLSLFKAVAHRLAHILKTANNQSGRPTCVVLDEPFIGTNIKVAEVNANRFLQKLGAKSHVLALVTSHLPAVKMLAEMNPGIFSNFYLGPNYALLPGVDPDKNAYKNVALEIIRAAFNEESGFLDEVQADLRDYNQD